MTQTTCHLSISVDGFVAGPDQDRDNPVGVGGLKLHEWHWHAGGYNVSDRMDQRCVGRLHLDWVGRNGRVVPLDRFGDGILSIRYDDDPIIARLQRKPHWHALVEVISRRTGWQRTGKAGFCDQRVITHILVS